MSQGSVRLFVVNYCFGKWNRKSERHAGYLTICTGAADTGRDIPPPPRPPPPSPTKGARAQVSPRAAAAASPAGRAPGSGGKLSPRCHSSPSLLLIPGETRHRRRKRRRRRRRWREMRRRRICWFESWTSCRCAHERESALTSSGDVRYEGRSYVENRKRSLQRG